jgi:hypothetical protein
MGRSRRPILGVAVTDVTIIIYPLEADFRVLADPMKKTGAPVGLSGGSANTAFLCHFV